MRKPVPMLLLLLIPVTQVWAEMIKAPGNIEGATTLTAEKTIELILNDPSLVVIDSRKFEEFEKGHIESAINLPDTDMNAEVLAQYVASHDSPILFYCHGPRCLRSTNAITMAVNWGYQQLYWFRGGWLEWQQKKLPVAQ